MNQSRILPFYMAYPLPLYYQEEDTITRDLEYLQQMYPAEAKRYQKVIVDILNTMDYEGSCIYDEYPDKWQLYKLTQAVMDRIRKMETEEPREGIEEFVQVLLYYEIYKKRHANNKGILKF
ncbi:MAG: hypothetical protein J1E98_09905 [Lachnospiraceae bacterium]|nr:hypothetical protein [Lachnospiraceae bacterium]